jgi:hypothetical protein
MNESQRIGQTFCARDSLNGRASRDDGTDDGSRSGDLLGPGRSAATTFSPRSCRGSGPRACPLPRCPRRLYVAEYLAHSTVRNDSPIKERSRWRDPKRDQQHATETQPPEGRRLGWTQRYRYPPYSTSSTLPRFLVWGARRRTSSSTTSSGQPPCCGSAGSSKSRPNRSWSCSPAAPTTPDDGDAGPADRKNQVPERPDMVTSPSRRHGPIKWLTGTPKMNSLRRGDEGWVDKGSPNFGAWLCLTACSRSPSLGVCPASIEPAAWPGRKSWPTTASTL